MGKITIKPAPGKGLTQEEAEILQGDDEEEAADLAIKLFREHRIDGWNEDHTVHNERKGKRT